MDWVGLQTNPLWAELWSSQIVADKIGALKNQLLNTTETDAHTLGELRGQLQALQWLKSKVEFESKQQMNVAAGEVTKTEERAALTSWLRRRRI